RLQADLALDLVGVEVGDGAALVHAAEPGHGAGVEQHRRDKRRLPAATMADHGHVPDGGWLVDLHSCTPPRWSSRTGAAGALSVAAVSPRRWRERGARAGPTGGRGREARTARGPGAGRTRIITSGTPIMAHAWPAQPRPA